MSAYTLYHLIQITACIPESSMIVFPHLDTRVEWGGMSHVALSFLRDEGMANSILAHQKQALHLYIHRIGIDRGPCTAAQHSISTTWPRLRRTPAILDRSWLDHHRVFRVQSPNQSRYSVPRCYHRQEDRGRIHTRTIYPTPSRAKSRDTCLAYRSVREYLATRGSLLSPDKRAGRGRMDLPRQGRS